MNTLSEAEIVEIDGGDFRTRYRWMLRELSNLNAPALAAKCFACETPMSWRQWLTSANHAQTECAQCGRWLYFDDCTADEPSEEFLREFREPDFFAQTWYHATRKENWFEEIQSASEGELIVHAGSKLAALSRGDWLRTVRSGEESFDGAPIYLHSFRLNSPERFSKALLNDCDEAWQEELSKPYPMDTILRAPGSQDHMVTLSEETPGAAYYNRYELPGTLSILFAVGCIDSASISTEVLS